MTHVNILHVEFNEINNNINIYKIIVIHI
jgi:hypothetical protein